MEKSKIHRFPRFWGKKKSSASSPSTSYSSFPAPAGHPSSIPKAPDTTGLPQPAPVTEPLGFVVDRSDRSVPNVSPAVITAATPAIRPVDRELQGVSRTDAWLGRATLFLKVTRDVADVVGVLAPLKAACGATITLLEAVQAVESNREAWNELLSSVRWHQKAFVRDLDRNDVEFDALEADHPLGAVIKEYQTAITEVVASIFREAGITEAEIKQNKTTVKRLATRIGTTTLEANLIIDYRNRLTEAKDAIMLSLQVYIAKFAQDIQENDLLKELRIPGLEHGSHLEGCMEKTRHKVMNQLQEWIKDMDAPNIFWLKGHPGVGKSAIATSLVKQLRVSRRLGSHFFFQRQNDAEMSPHALWRTVAYELAQTYPAVRSRVAVDCDRLDRLKILAESNTPRSTATNTDVARLVPPPIQQNPSRGPRLTPESWELDWSRPESALAPVDGNSSAEAPSS